MSENTNEAIGSVQQEEPEQHPHPFGEFEAEVFEITDRFDLAQFTEELKKKAKGEVHTVLSHFEGVEPPSKDKPAKLFVRGAKRTTIQSILDEHEPKEPAEVDPKDAIQNIKDGKDVSHDELLAAIRHLVSQEK